MKLKNSNFFLLIMLLVGIVSYGQYETVQTYKHSGSIVLMDLRSRGIVGTAYINDQFLSATLPNTNKVYPMRYNAYKDEMEFERDGKLYNLNKVLYLEIIFVGTNKTYKVFLDNENETNSRGYFVVLLKGEKISLLNKEKINFFEAVKSKTSYDKYKPPTLKRIKDKLYIAYKNNTIIELPSKKKEFYNLFSSNSKEIKKFISIQKLSIKDIDDLIKIFEFYNSLN